MEDDLKFWEMEEDLNFWEMEVDFIFFVIMEEDLCSDNSEIFWFVWFPYFFLFIKS